MTRIIFTFLLTCLLIFISACTQGSSTGKEADYETTKKMVVDILKTDDGKKALSEIMKDEKLKKQLVIASDVVEDAINNVLVSEKGAEMWSNFFDNPTFVESFAQSMSEEQKKIIKSLMNDSEYQKQMLELLQNPEISQQMLSILKSQQFRSHLEETISQTLETPLFQTKITDILLKAAEEQNKGQQKEDQSKSSGEESNNGESSEQGDENSNKKGSGSGEE